MVLNSLSFPIKLSFYNLQFKMFIQMRLLYIKVQHLQI